MLFCPRIQRQMVLGNFQCRDVPLICFKVELWPSILVVGGREDCFDEFCFILSCSYLLSPSPEDCLVKTEILSKKAVRPLTTDQKQQLTVTGRLSVTVLTKPIRANLFAFQQ